MLLYIVRIQSIRLTPVVRIPRRICFDHFLKITKVFLKAQHNQGKSVEVQVEKPALVCRRDPSLDKPFTLKSLQMSQNISKQKQKPHTSQCEKVVSYLLKWKNLLSSAEDTLHTQKSPKQNVTVY